MLKQAYDQGVVAAMEKFALMPGGGMRAAAPISGSASKPIDVANMTFSGPQTGHMAQGAAANTAAANPALQPQSLGQRAWQGLNRVAANPVGQMGLMMGLPMAIDALRSRGQQQ